MRFHLCDRAAYALRVSVVAVTAPVVISSLVMRLSIPTKMLEMDHAGFQLPGWKLEKLVQMASFSLKRPLGVCILMVGGAKGYV